MISIGICPNFVGFCGIFQVSQVESQLWDCLSSRPWWTSSLPKAWGLKLQSSHAWREPVAERIGERRTRSSNVYLGPDGKKGPTMSWKYKYKVCIALYCIGPKSSAEVIWPKPKFRKRSEVFHVLRCMLIHISCQISLKSHRPSGGKGTAFVPLVVALQLTSWDVLGTYCW